MASQILTEPLKKAQQAIMGSNGDKIADLQRDTRESNDKSRMTSDSGVPQGNTDDWLKVVGENNTGPALLEDVFGREKVLARLQRLRICVVTGIDVDSADPSL